MADTMTVMPQSGHMQEIGTSHNSKLVDLNLRFGLKTVALLSMNTNTQREKLAYIYSAGLQLCYIRAVCLLWYHVLSALHQLGRPYSFIMLYFQQMEERGQEMQKTAKQMPETGQQCSLFT